MVRKMYIGFSVTKTAFYTQLTLDFRTNSKQAGCPQRPIYKVNFPGVILLIQGQDRSNLRKHNSLQQWTFLHILLNLKVQPLFTLWERSPT